MHALVVKRERSKQSLPYLLATQFCAGTVFGEDGKGVGAVVPQCLKSAIEQGFENVTVVRVQSHPGVLLLVVHNAFVYGDNRAAKADAGQHPSELETEDVEEEVDVARKVFVQVHAALAMTKRTHDHARPPRPTSSTTETRHVYIENTTTRAFFEPSLLFGPCQIGISPEYPLIKSLGPVRASITRILVLHYRMYLYTIRNSCHELICMTLSAT